MFVSRPTYRALILMLITAGCTSPDLSSQISDSLTLVKSSKDTVKDQLSAEAKKELAVAERAKALANQRIVDLPTGCVGAFGDPSLSVDHCEVQELAKPVDNALSATRVLMVYDSLENYFLALQSLAQSTDPDDIKAQSNRLLSAIGDFADTNDSASLDRLQGKISKRKDVAAMTAGFLANQARQKALRDVMEKADLVIEKLVSRVQFKLLDSVDQRAAAMTAFDAYNDALSDKRPAEQLKAAAKLRTAIAEMHAQEKVSPLRKLYLARELHGAMLSRLTRKQNFDDVEALLIEVTDILIALEDE